MDIKTAIKTIMQAAGKNSIKTAAFLGISKQAFSIFLNTDFNQIKRFIKICNYCGYNVIITDNKNFSIVLSADQDDNTGDQENKQ